MYEYYYQLHEWRTETGQFGDCPIDDTIMSPDTLIRITDINRDLLQAILHSREAAEALCGLVEDRPENDAHTEKPSVLDQIREAAKTPKELHRDKSTRDKSGPEL